MNYPTPDAWPVPGALEVPVAAPVLPPEAIQNAVEALKSTEISGASKIIPQVEQELATSWSCFEAVLVSNGSVALILALTTLGIRAGDEVLVPNFCYAAVASSVIHVGAEPVFCDVDDDWNLSEQSARAMLSERTKALITVDNYGNARDWSSFHLWARSQGLSIVHDSAEGHGATFGGRATGLTADAITTSFFANKILTTGEGGAVLFPQEGSLASAARKLRGQGMSASHRFWFDSVGYNFRMPAVCASLLPPQLQLLEKVLEHRRLIFARYDDHLAGFSTRVLDTEGRMNAPWLYTASFPKLNTYSIANHLARQGIESRPAFYPLSSMPAFSRFKSTMGSKAFDISGSSMSLPTSSKMSLEMVDRIAQLVVAACKNSA